MAARKAARKASPSGKASKKTVRKKPVRKKPARKTTARKKKGATKKKPATRKPAARRTARREVATPLPKAWALALSGDWAQAPFLAGALHAWQRRRPKPELRLVAGSGAGALLAALAALGRWDEIEESFSALEGRALARPRYGWLPGGAGARLSLANLTSNPSLFLPTEGLEQLLQAGIDFDALCRARVEAHFVTVDLQSGNLRTFSNRQDPPEELAGGLRAALSRPVLLPPVRAGYARHQHAEGSLREHGPLRTILRALGRVGAPEVGALLVVGGAGSVAATRTESFRAVADVASRTLELMHDRAGRQDLRSAQLINALVGLRTQIGPTRFARALEQLDPATRAEAGRHLEKRYLPLWYLPEEGASAEAPFAFDASASRARFEQGAAALRAALP